MRLPMIRFSAVCLLLALICGGCRFLPPRESSPYANLGELLVAERGVLSKQDALRIDSLFEQAAREKQLDSPDIYFLCAVVDRVKGKPNEETFLTIVGTTLGSLRYLPQETRPDVTRITKQMTGYAKRHRLRSTLSVTAQRLQDKLTL